MKPLPGAVLALLETLPPQTRKVILNTNGAGHWEIEVFMRYSLDEESPREYAFRAELSDEKD
jgi:hypothetical protein